ncbi:MAG TPA: hypothetical protein VF400_09855 [Anaeromyxobacteraceae bacterium]
MKKLLSMLVVVALAMPIATLAETWEKVTLIDQSCAAKFKANPDEHTTACAKKCAKNGLGMLTPDGAWLKLDAAGNKQAIAALNKTDKKDHVRATVTGEKSGDTVKVESLKLVD